MANRIAEYDLNFLIKSLEATKESARSIAQNWTLLALQELSNRRAAERIWPAPETAAAPLVLHHTFEPHKGLQICTPDCPACAFQRTGSTANRRESR